MSHAAEEIEAVGVGLFCMRGAGGAGLANNWGSGPLLSEFRKVYDEIVPATNLS